MRETLISPIRPIVQRTAGIVRHSSRRGERIARRVASDAFGVVQRVRHIRQSPKPGMDDVTLARKVETEVFRPADSPKGDIDINAVDGVVYLRGEVKHADDIDELERRTRRIPEVRGVENLLHMRKTPAPTRADSPGRQRRTAGSGRRTQRSSEEQ